MKLSKLGKLLPYWVIEKITKSFGKTGAKLKVGDKEFSVKLLFLGDKECGFWYSDEQELRKRVKHYKNKILEYENEIEKVKELLEE